MEKLEFAQDAEAALEVFLSFWPEISKEDYRNNLYRKVQYLNYQNSLKNHISKDTMIQAIEELFPSFETFILHLKDPSAIQTTISKQQKVDLQNPIVKIERWEVPESECKKPGKDIFAFLAGPRIGGNTDLIMNAVLEGAAEKGSKVEKVHFSKINITPCSGCLYCQRQEREHLCSIRDDMDYIYKRFQECDAFVLGFPIYSARQSSHACVFMDRLKALSNPWERKKVEMRKLCIVATWGWPSPYLYKDVVYNTAFIFKHFGFQTTEVVSGCGFWDAYYKADPDILSKSGIENAKKAGAVMAL